MALYSFHFQVRPRADSPEYRRIGSREIAVWITRTAEAVAEVDARNLVQDSGYDIDTVKVREWDTTSLALQSNAGFQRLFRDVERDGYVLQVFPGGLGC